MKEIKYVYNIILKFPHSIKSIESNENDELSDGND